MSYYVELLRAKRALFVCLIILAMFAAIAIVMRLSVGGTTPDDLSKQIVGSPTAHVVHSTLPGGWARTVVDDPARKLHAVIDRKADTVRMDVTEPAKDAPNRTVSFGNMNRNVTDNTNGMRHMQYEFTGETPTYPVGIMFVFSIVIGLITATMLGGVLSKENDGHLELAWTKPVSREYYALTAVGVDVAAIIISQLSCVLVGLLCTLLFFVPHFSTGPNTLAEIGIAFAGPIAWYALLNAASASIKRGPGLVIGLGWVLAIIVPTVAGALDGIKNNSVVALWFHAIFSWLALIDPVTYFTLNFHGGTVVTGSGFAPSTNVAVLTALFIAYIALSLVQWRRVEA